MNATECTIAEMKATNKRLGLLTQNLGEFNVDPMGGFQLGQGVGVGKRPFYADRTVNCNTTDHDQTNPVILFSPPPNTWAAIVWWIVNQFGNVENIVYRDQRVPGDGLPQPRVPAGDGVVCDQRIMWRGDVRAASSVFQNMYPGAFIVNYDEVLFLGREPDPNAIFSMTLGYTIGKNK